MGQGISEVLTFAVGVAITVSAIIAVILMLFSQRARRSESQQTRPS
jgi:ABC-type nickel/cobalt efflux system permease component RcnA